MKKDPGIPHLWPFKEQLLDQLQRQREKISEEQVGVCSVWMVHVLCDLCMHVPTCECTSCLVLLPLDIPNSFSPFYGTFGFCLEDPPWHFS